MFQGILDLLECFLAKQPKLDLRDYHLIVGEPCVDGVKPTRGIFRLWSGSVPG
jgi:hypothetical protein